MDKKIVAALCNELYHSGNGENTENKLSERDFIELVSAARGKAIMNAYWMARNANMGIEESGFLNSYIKKSEFPVNNGTIEFPYKLLTLPHGWGVYSIEPSNKDCDIDLIRIDAGTKWKIKIAGASKNESYFEVFSDKIIIHYAKPCLKKVFVLHVPEEDDNIASDVIFDIINIIFSVLLKVKGFPIDQQDDNNPNVTVVNKKIAEAQIQ